MRALSLTGGPKVPGPSSLLLLVVLVAVLMLHGCAHVTYQAVPQCEPANPPKGERWVKATPDEKLVLMTSAYIKQTKVVADCNADIRLINAANKAADK